MSRQINWRRLVPCLLACLMVSAGCDSGGGGSTVPGEPGDGNPPDVPMAGRIEVREAELDARIDDGAVWVRVPIHRRAGGKIKGQVQVELREINEVAAVGVGTAAIEGDADLLTVEVRIPWASGAEAPSDLADLVLEWRVESDAGRVHGVRSLFTAWSQKTATWLVGNDRLAAGETARLRVMTQDVATGQPRPNVAFRLRLVPAEGEPREIHAGATDENGEAVVEVVADEAQVGDARLEVEVDAPGVAQAAGQAVVIERLSRVMLTTDKPIYQPGQIIHLRALALRRPHLRPEANQPLVFEIHDARGNLIERLFTETDAYGVGHTQLQLAREINLGAWRVSARVGDVVSEKTVTVDRYTLPKYDLTLTLDRGVYLAGSQLQGVVRAQYFFGHPVAGGEVAVQAATLDVDRSVFAELAGRTNDEGLFQFEIQLPQYVVGLPLAQGGGVIELAIAVTDTAGQSRTLTRQVRIARAPIEVVAVPEGGLLRAGLRNRVFVRSVDAGGTPVAARHTVRVDDEVRGEVVANDNGIAFVEIDVPVDATSMVLSLDTTAPDETEVTNDFTLSVDGNAIDGSVLVRTDQALYRVGDSLVVEAHVIGAPDRVFLDLIRGGQTVLTTSLTPDVEGVARQEIDLTPDHVGPLTVSAWYLAQGSSLRRDSKVVYVESADRLRIEIAPDQDVYAPGEEALLRVRVTDEAGVGKAAALGLQGVDEAVYALVESRPGLEKVYFRIEGEIAEPRYQVGVPGLATLTAADDAEDDPARQEQAALLFAATDATAGGLSINTWAGVPALAIARSKEGFVVTGEAFRDAVRQALERRGTQEVEAAREFLRAGGVRAPVDGWGQVTRVEVADWTVKLLSPGLDELWDTDDDIDYSFEFSAAGPGGVHDGGAAPGWREEDDRDNWGGGAGGAGGGGGGAGPPDEAGGGGPRIRRHFPETLFVEPALITNGSGEAELRVPMADSITTWRISALANSADGLLGSTDQGVRVFQDFFVDLDVPVALTRGDEYSVPVALYNYLDEPQQVRLEVQEAPWFTLLGEANMEVQLAAGEVRGVRLPLRVEQVGLHELTVIARGSRLSDGVARLLRVEPDGRRVERVVSGALSGPVTYLTETPADAIPGSGKLLVRLHPGLMSQVVAGLEGVLQFPSGCFEQTSASTWPNVLVLRYLEETQSTDVESIVRAKEYINAGYQRLLTFEVNGGGFEWFGSPPAHVVLTAYGLLEFTDMAAVRTVDEAMLARTRAWLLARQQADGRWEAGDGGLDETGQLRDPVTVTAYVAFALAAAGERGAPMDQARAYLEGHRAAMGSYTLALYGNFLAAAAPADPLTRTVLDELARRVQTNVEAGEAHWDTDEQTTTYGRGESAWIETTALATHALMEGNAHPAVVEQALGWLVTRRDGGGAWGSTAGTVWTIKCLLRALSGGRDDAADATVSVLLDEVERASFRITPQNSDVMRQADLSDALTPGVPQEVGIVLAGEGRLTYDVVESWHVPWDGEAPSDGPLSIAVSYDRTTLAVDDQVTVSVTVTNRTIDFADMVMVDLGIPPGFDLVREDLDALRQAGIFERYEATQRQLLLYFSFISPDAPVAFEYRIQARDPVHAQAPPSRVYSYYNPDVGDEAEPIEVEVN